MKEQQIQTTSSKVGKYYFMTITHLPTGAIVEGEGKIYYRLRLDLLKELHKLTADYRNNMVKELAGPNEVKSELNG
jgi:hypothetical protein